MPLVGASSDSGLCPSYSRDTYYNNQFAVSCQLSEMSSLPLVKNLTLDLSLKLNLKEGDEPCRVDDLTEEEVKAATADPLLRLCFVHLFRVCRTHNQSPIYKNIRALVWAMFVKNLDNIKKNDHTIEPFAQCYVRSLERKVLLVDPDYASYIQEWEKKCRECSLNGLAYNIWFHCVTSHCY